MYNRQSPGGGRGPGKGGQIKGSGVSRGTGGGLQGPPPIRVAQGQEGLRTIYVENDPGSGIALSYHTNKCSTCGLIHPEACIEANRLRQSYQPIVKPGTPNPDLAKNPNADVDMRENQFGALDLDKSFARMSMEKTFPFRPGYGTKGRPLNVFTNYFKIATDKNLILYRYNFSVTPEPLSVSGRRHLVERIISTLPFLGSALGLQEIATDYRGFLITTKKIVFPGDSQDRWAGILPPQGANPPPTAKQINITIDKGDDVDVHALVAYLREPTKNFAGQKESILQALNVFITRNAGANRNLAQLKGNKFFPIRLDRPPHILGDMLEGLLGYYTSVRPSVGRLLLNVNITAAAIRAGGGQNVVDGIMSHFDTGPAALAHLSKVLKGLRVELTHLPPRTPGGQHPVKTIWGLSKNPRTRLFDQYPENTKFDKDIKGVKTPTLVSAHFRQAYNIKLAHPDYQLVNVGNDANPIHMPPELCRIIPGQTYGKKLSSTQTAAMMALANRAPWLNIRDIAENALKELGLPIEGAAYKGRAPSITIEPNLLVVRARILNSPKLSAQPPGTGREKSFETRPGGGWNWKNASYLNRKSIPGWNVMQIMTSGPLGPCKGAVDRMLDGICKDFRGTLMKMGMGIAKPMSEPCAFGIGSGREQDIDQAFANLMKNPAAQSMVLILVADNERAERAFPIIKYFADCKYGILTVVVKRKFFQVGDNGAMFHANVGMKINLRLGGINFKLAQPLVDLRDTILLGIDVTHPSPDSAQNAPSIAAVVGSIDDNGLIYPADIKVNPRRAEKVSNLDEMVFGRIKLWQKKHNGRLPQNILVYRDGVSEGQYGMVRTEEGASIDAAIARLWPPKQAQPKVTIVIVGKRHHTRFYPMNNGDGDNKGNCQPGTIVDRGVTMEQGYDFFLQAHAAIQGTAKPAHYVVVRDEMKWGADKMQQFTHDLCYTWQRALRSVSICPPAYYADKAAERARLYLASWMQDAEGREYTETGSAAGSAGQGGQWRRGVHPNLEETMFYV
ncbi:hypothetical protein MMC25_003981 [Agyrium rufum]|nr:hypothetical protein [Agyrium rufum]